MKRIIIFVLTAVILLSMGGCTKKKADNTLCIIEHFGNADAVPQLPERYLSRKAGIVRCCLKLAGAQCASLRSL